MPVQAAAACSLRMMIESDETTELLRPLIHRLIGEYFRIMSEIESDAVLSALQVRTQLRENLSNSIKSFLVNNSR